MTIGRLAKQLELSVTALVFLGTCPVGAAPEAGHSHPTRAQAQELTPAEGALLQAVRESTERFKAVSVAEREGYALLFGCVSGPDSGPSLLYASRVGVEGASQ